MNPQIKQRIEQIKNGEVPEGYRTTKDDIQPEDWSDVILGDFVLGMKSGLSRKLNEYDIGVPVIRSNNVANNIIDFTNIKYWYLEDPQGANTRNYFLNDGDIIINFINSISQIGKTAMFVNIIGRDTIFTTNLLKMTLKSQLDSWYFIYFSNTQKYFKYINAITKPAINQASFTTVDLKRMRISLPPLPEQQKIATILSTWDKAIALQEKLIAQKKEQKRGLMQRLLTGKVRLSGFDGEWEEVRLGDVAKIVTGTTPSTKINDYYGGEYPWITPTDINDSKYISKSERTLTKNGLERGRYVPKGSVLVTCIASIGKNSILTVDGSCNQQINAVLPSTKYCGDYLYYLLCFSVNILKAYAGTSATSILNKNTFSNIRFSLPEVIEQKSISNVISTIDKQLQLLESKSNAIHEQKKGLMQLLLTGIVRVKV